MAEDPDTLAWAEFGEFLRQPESSEDYIDHVPWDTAGFDTSRPLLDIGCGSGLTTQVLAHRFTGTEVIAVEPDPLMRALLMRRVADDELLRDRVTVVPEPITECWLPAESGGALLFNVIYFLSEPAREAFWERMSQVMVPGAPILLSRSYGGVPVTEVPMTLLRKATIGRQEYQRWFAARPFFDQRSREDRVEIINTYRVLRDGEQVREVVTRITPQGLDEETVLGEIPIGRFSIEELDERYVAVRRAPDLRR